MASNQVSGIGTILDPTKKLSSAFTGLADTLGGFRGSQEQKQLDIAKLLSDQTGFTQTNIDREQGLLDRAQQAKMDEARLGLLKAQTAASGRSNKGGLSATQQLKQLQNKAVSDTIGNIDQVGGVQRGSEVQAGVANVYSNAADLYSKNNEDLSAAYKTAEGEYIQQYDSKGIPIPFSSTQEGKQFTDEQKTLDTGYNSFIDQLNTKVTTAQGQLDNVTNPERLNKDLADRLRVNAGLDYKEAKTIADDLTAQYEQADTLEEQEKLQGMINKIRSGADTQTTGSATGTGTQTSGSILGSGEATKLSPVKSAVEAYTSDSLFNWGSIDRERITGAFTVGRDKGYSDEQIRLALDEATIDKGFFSGETKLDDKVFSDRLDAQEPSGVTGSRQGKAGTKGKVTTKVFSPATQARLTVLEDKLATLSTTRLKTVKENVAQILGKNRTFTPSKTKKVKAELKKVLKQTGASVTEIKTVDTLDKDTLKAYLNMK